MNAKIYDVVIIGAGMAGLSAALELSSKGKKIIVLERQSQPGGLATNFKRKDFVFESSIHCVNDLGPEGQITQFLKNYGLEERIELIPLKKFARVIYPEHNFILDFQIQHFIDYLKLNFAQEAGNIERLFLRYAKFYKEFEKFSQTKIPLWLLPIFSPSLYRALSSTAADFIKKDIRDPKLLALLTDIWSFAGLPPEELSAFYFLLILRGYYYKPTAYPRGGFGKFFGAIVEKIRENGAEVLFNTAVEKIITEKAKIKGVFTEKGQEIFAKVVISNANSISTLTELLDERMLKEQYIRQMADLEKSVSAFQVYLGLRSPAQTFGMDCPIFSIKTTYDHQKNFFYSRSADYAQAILTVVDYTQFDTQPNLSKKGTLSLITLDRWQNWIGFTQEEYQKRKKEVAQILIQRLEKFLPGLSGAIEVMEIATPLTIARFAQVKEGAIYGFSCKPQQCGFKRLSQQTKIKGLLLAGAWTRPGPGIHACFISGLDAAQLALRFLER